MLKMRRERLVSDYIHMVDHITDTTVLFDDGSAFAMFDVEGLPWETADTVDVAKWHSDYNLALRNIATDTIILSVYQSRRMADVGDYPRVAFASDFAEALDRRYRARIFDGLLYSNHLFLGVQIRPPRYAGEVLGEQFTKRSRSADEALEDRRQRLEDTCAMLQASLAAYRPRRLGCVVRGNAVFSEIAEAIVLATTGVWRPIGLTTGRLGNGMLSEQVITGREAIELRAAGWSHYAAVFGLREYPASTWPGMFAALSVAPYRSTLFQSFRFLSKADAHAVMSRKQNRMAAAGDKALSQQAELDVAADDLASNRFVMGDHSLSFVVFAGSMRALGNVATAAWRDLADCGAVVAREGAALEAAYFSMIPGNTRLRVRPGVISSRNFCAMAPLHNFPSGAEHGHWGAPVALLRTSGGTPYRFHWHLGDVGNTLVTGETGSGKSLLVGFLLAMTAARARIIALDHKRGWELLIRAMRGQYAVLGAGQPHFAPLKALDAAPRNIEFLTELLRGCIMIESDEALTPEEDRRLTLGLQTVMCMPPSERWIAEVRAFLGEDANGAGARLDKWCWGSELGWVIDAPADAISLSGVLHGLDTTALLENPRARGPALLYLFHRIEMQLDGRPLLIPNDEGWRALLDDTFRPMIDKRLRTIRSFGGAFVFITQSPRDILDSGIAATLVEQCPTQIHMPNPRATADDYVHGLKRTRAEFEALRELPKGSGLFLLCQGDKSTIAQLPLHGMDDDIAILSGREATVRLMEDVAGNVGDDPADWLPELSRRMRELAA